REPTREPLGDLLHAAVVLRDVLVPPGQPRRAPLQSLRRSLLRSSAASPGRRGFDVHGPPPEQGACHHVRSATGPARLDQRREAVISMTVPSGPPPSRS